MNRALVAAVLLLSACTSGTAPQPSSTTAAKPAAPSTTASLASPVASPSPAASAGAHVSLAYSVYAVTNLPLWVAKEMGIYAQSGLDVDEQYIASTNTMAALLSGQVQVASTGGSEVLSAVANGADLVVLATPLPVYPYLFEARPEIKTVADLKGKTIAITNPGSSFDITTRILLQHEGLDPDRDVNLVKTGSVENVTSALVSGNVDAGLANVPDNLKIEAAGMHSIFDTTKLGAAASSNVLAAQRAFTAAQRDVTQRFIDDWVEALARMKKDRSGAIQVYAQYTQSQDTDAMGTALDYYTQHAFPGLPFPKPEQFVDAQKITGAVNAKVLELPIESILDPSFVQSSADRGIDKR